MAAKLGWGLIGTSTISREWMIDAIRAEGDAEIVAVHSRDQGRGERFAAETGISRVYDRLDAFLADPAIDIVYIATTNDRHHGEVLAAAAAGKHVLCDKPLTLTVAEGLAMVAACAEAGVVFGTNHHLRQAASHRAIRDLVQGGRIGRPVTVRVSHGALLPEHLRTWRIKDPSTGAGAVLDLTVHNADTVRFVLDDEIVRAAAMVTDSGMGGPGIEDTAISLLRTAKGALVQFQDVFNTPFNQTSLEIHGTRGSILARDVMTQRPVGSVVLRDAEGEREIPLEQENLYVRHVRLFQQAVRDGGTPPCTGLDGVRSLAVALAVLEAAASGREVDVAPVAP